MYESCAYLATLQKKKRQWEMSERFVTRRRYNTILRTHGEDWEDRLHLPNHHNG